MSNIKIFTDNIDQKALDQINNLVKQPAFSDCKIRIMPDVHSGSGCVIGFTSDLGDKVIPNIVGVDIGCGMRVVKLKDKNINLQGIDEVIRKYVPSGRNVHENIKVEFDKLNNLYCYQYLNDIDRIKRSIGTLGGGNHFIEIDNDKNNDKYLVIHSGSRNLGKQVAEYYQNLAIENMYGKEKLSKEVESLIREYKKNGKSSEIQVAVMELKAKQKNDQHDIPKELCYLSGEYRNMYLHDMKICQEYAVENRKAIVELIINNCGLAKESEFETIHNYIDYKSNIVRKGAISAKCGEKLIIPINMRDGCIIGFGKGNIDWNESAPHGAGRIMSRSKAKEKISIEEYKESMEEIYTTSVNQYTIDEAPMAYKSIDEIVNNINDTVEIIDIIKPIYNFKAVE